MIGLVVGVLPGLGGTAGLSLVLPFALLVPVLVRQLRGTKPDLVFHDTDFDPGAAGATITHYLAWIIAMLGAVALVGFPFAMLAFIFIFTTVKAGRNDLRNGTIGLFILTFLGVMSYFLTLKYPSGLLQTFVDMPWWIGG